MGKISEELAYFNLQRPPEARMWAEGRKFDASESFHSSCLTVTHCQTKGAQKEGRRLLTIPPSSAFPCNDGR